MELSPAESHAKLWELIKNIRFAMLTTRHDDGTLRSRPMTTQNTRLNEDASLWFFASRVGGLLADIAVDSQVNVSYADPGSDRYVSVSGSAMEVDDLPKKKQMWSKLDQGWFPGGVNDPDLALLEVRIDQAELWDAKGNKAVQLFNKAKAAVTGTTTEQLGEHGQVRLR